ncbi:hypothetical protein [Stieleria mannarensis]|nr:hypothetical protein [Rhodopirellula sp. JC639]
MKRREFCVSLAVVSVAATPSLLSDFQQSIRRQGIETHWKR